MVQHCALVLPGGGARAAYQVGALRAIARIHGKAGPLPFPILCGTSAGAINAVAIAQHADDFRRGVARLARWWRRVAVPRVYEADFGALSLHSARFLAAVLMGAKPPPGVAALLDNTPLAGAMAREFDFARVRRHIDDGHLAALAVNATSYTTGHAVTFFQAAAGRAGWQRMRRRGVAALLGVEHLLASVAIPFLFAAGRIGDDYYMDGSVRQSAPLSAALNLGARRILVIAVGQFSGQRADHAGPAPYPSFAQAAGHALSTIFLDNLAVDIERLVQVNRLVDRMGAHAQGDGIGASHVDALVLAPSADLGEIALQHAHRLPPAARTLLHGLGSTRGTGSNLVSYLLFDRAFCAALAALGYADTMARRSEVSDFMAGAPTAAPMLPPRFG